MNMRALSDSEKDVLTKRRQAFGAFLEERMPVMASFAEQLEIYPASRIVSDPSSCIEPIARFVRYQSIEPEDRVRLITRLGYYIGELLIQRCGGCWGINELPGTRFFLRYVVWQFARPINPNAQLDPFEIAAVLLDSPADKDLRGVIDAVLKELTGSEP